jgi:hypothetical protein
MVPQGEQFPLLLLILIVCTSNIFRVCEKSPELEHVGTTRLNPLADGDMGYGLEALRTLNEER